MDRIANAKVLAAELQAILSYTEQPNPSRQAIATRLQDLAARVGQLESRTAASTGAFDKAVKDVGAVQDALKGLESALKEGAKSHEGPKPDDPAAERKADQLAKELDKVKSKFNKLEQTMFRVYDAITGGS